MFIVSILISLLVPVGIIAAVVAAVAAVRRRSEDAPPDPGIGTVRRLFIYGVAFIALMLTAGGLALLIGGAADALAGDTIISSNDSALASALALTVVGAPAWLIFALLAQRSVAQHPVERRSQARRVYLDLARAVALVTAVVSGIMVTRMVLRLDAFEGGPVGWFLVGSAVWTLHDRLAAAEPAETTDLRLFDRLTLYLGALIGLYLTAWTAGYALRQPLVLLYDGLFRDPLAVGSPYDDVREALAVAVVTVPVWAWHWHRGLARRDAGTTAWYAYLFLAGITVAATATVVAAAMLVYLVLSWLIGDPGSASAVSHFDESPTLVSIGVVSALLWGYHRAVLREDAPRAETWSTPERIYRYLMAAGGLFTASIGLVALVALVIEAVVPEPDDLVLGAGWWRDQLVVGLTFLLVGVPLWVRYWFQAQEETEDEGQPERDSLPRRAFLFGVFSLAALAVLIDLTIVLYRLFEGLLDGTISGQTVLDMRWQLAIVLVAGVVGVYYWLILQEDQRAKPDIDAEEARTSAPIRRIVLLGSEAEELARDLAALPGVQVQRWEPLEAERGDLDRGAILEAVQAAPEGDYLLLIEAGAFRLLPYRPS